MPTKPYISIGNLVVFLCREGFYILTEEPFYIFRRESDDEIYPCYPYEGIVYLEDVRTSIAKWKHPEGVGERFVQFVNQIEEWD